MTVALQEAGFALREGALQADGTVEIVVIRPGVGRGRGRHYYGRDMLRENAHLWTGVKMYANHLSEKARRALEGLPRPIEHTAGRILESWWDDKVPADARFEQGAVMGRVKPLGYVKSLIEEDPSIVETSISASATNTRPSTMNGQRVNIVEGIAEHPHKPGMASGSVDFVTEAGAGGKVVEAIREAAEQYDSGLLESLNDDELRAYIAQERPELSEALGITDGDGGSRAPNNDEEEDVDITPEALREALTDPENRQVLVEITTPLIEAALDIERDGIIREAQAELQRGIDLRDMRDEASRLIAEAALPEKFAEKAKARFALNGTQPSSALDVYDDLDSDGNVVKSRDELLKESVTEVIEEMRDLAGSVKPTRISGQGRGEGGDGAGGGKKESTSASRVDPQTRKMLQESGMTDEDIENSYGSPLVGVIGS